MVNQGESILIEGSAYHSKSLKFGPIKFDENIENVVMRKMSEHNNVFQQRKYVKLFIVRETLDKSASKLSLKI